MCGHVDKVDVAPIVPTKNQFTHVRVSELAVRLNTRRMRRTILGSSAAFFILRMSNNRNACILDPNSEISTHDHRYAAMLVG